MNNELNPSIRSVKEQVDELIEQNRMILEFNLKALNLLTSVVQYVNQRHDEERINGSA